MNNKFEPVIKWSGSKRLQSYEIKSYFPEFNRYFEPFIGGGSMLYTIDNEGVAGDICEPLIGLWNIIKNNPQELIEYYEREWNRLQDEGHEVYYDIRTRFNKDFDPKDLLFLSRTCVNGLIRFNQDGEFNNSFHHSRKGINPKRLEKIINIWSSRIQNKEFIHGDYRETTATAKEGDFVYLDPPYFNTKGRYFGKIDYDEFIQFLYDLKSRNIKYALSYDGIRGEENFIVDIPEDLYERHILIESGNSSFKKVMDKSKEKVLESLYLSW